MAKTFLFRLFGRDGYDNGARMTGAPGESSAAESFYGGRFFTLFASVVARSDAATSVPGDQGAFTFNSDVPAALLLQQTNHPVAEMVVPLSEPVQDLNDDAEPAPVFVPAPEGSELPAAGHNAAVLLSIVASQGASSAFGRFELIDHLSNVGGNGQNDTFYDSLNNQLLVAGPSYLPQFGGVADDTLVLWGDYSDGVLIRALVTGIDIVIATAGYDYNLSVDDHFVAARHILTIDGSTLGAYDHLRFDGSAERDGSFDFSGGASSDTFIGGAGDDRIAGGDGADMLTGGGGSDVFVYTSAGESSSSAYDTLVGFDPVHDRIDLPGSVSGFGATISQGNLSAASLNADLSALLGGLGASQAVWLSPSGGDLAGKIFLVVDGNGVAGYQPGEDFVFAVSGVPLADLTAHPSIFV